MLFAVLIQALPGVSNHAREGRREPRRALSSNTAGSMTGVTRKTLAPFKEYNKSALTMSVGGWQPRQARYQQNKWTGWCPRIPQHGAVTDVLMGAPGFLRRHGADVVISPPPTPGPPCRIACPTPRGRRGPDPPPPPTARLPARAYQTATRAGDYECCGGATRTAGAIQDPPWRRRRAGRQPTAGGAAAAAAAAQHGRGAERMV